MKQPTNACSYNEYHNDTNKLVGQPIADLSYFREKMSLNTPYLDHYILLISGLQNAGNANSEVSETQTLTGENRPGPL